MRNGNPFLMLRKFLAVGSQVKLKKNQLGAGRTVVVVVSQRKVLGSYKSWQI